MNDDHKKTLQALHELRRVQDARDAELEKELALLKQRFDEMRVDREKWVMRAWAITGPVIAALAVYFLGIKR